MAEASVELTGFCEACSAANLAERYHERETREAEARNRAWREWDRVRHQKHRLLTKLEPAEFASPSVDPLELGKQALEVLWQIKVQDAYQRGLREEVAELVRQLAWGPEQPGKGSERRRNRTLAG